MYHEKQVKTYRPKKNFQNTKTRIKTTTRLDTAAIIPYISSLFIFKLTSRRFSLA